MRLVQDIVLYSAKQSTDGFDHWQVADAKTENFKSMNGSLEGQQMLSNQVPDPRTQNL